MSKTNNSIRGVRPRTQAMSTNPNAMSTEHNTRMTSTVELGLQKGPDFGDGDQSITNFLIANRFTVVK